MALSSIASANSFFSFAFTSARILRRREEVQGLRSNDRNDKALRLRPIILSRSGHFAGLHHSVELRSRNKAEPLSLFL